MSRRRWFRPGIIYGFETRRPGSRRKPWGYIGKTRQRLSARVAQHMTGPDAKSWADLVVPCRGTVAHVLYRSDRVSTVGLAWREWWFIKTRMPLYNVTWNLANPRHVPKWRAVEQRRERDARRGVQPWGAPTGRRGLPVVGALLLVLGVLVLGVLVLASLAAL